MNNLNDGGTKMQKYLTDIFYEVNLLTTKQKKEICQFAYDNNIDFWVDWKDAEHWVRQRIEMSFEEIMRKLNRKCHFVIIHRRGYRPHEFCGEVGFCTMITKVDYFLWLNITEDRLGKLVEMFDLKIMQ